MAGTVRVAVDAGSAVVRVAVAVGPGASARVVAEVPRSELSSDDDLAALIAAYAGRRPDELVLVHAAGAAPPSGTAGLARRVRAMPAPVAAAVGTGAVAVLDAGHSGVGVTVLGPGGFHERLPCGGGLLDAELAPFCPDGDVTGVRERLSLLPRIGPVGGDEVAPLLDEVLSAPAAALRAGLRRTGADGPVLLVGGLAATPALAAAVDAAGIVGATVVASPGTAAVLGALRTPEPQPPAEPARSWLPPPATRPRSARGHRRMPAVLASVLLVAGLLVAGLLLPTPVPSPAPGGEVVQYGYRTAVPDGWAHTGGRPERRRVLLTPGGAPDGSDLVAIEATPLTYDPTAEPERAGRELRRVFDDGLAGGAALSDYRTGTTFAGRAVTTYRQRGADGVTIDWYVLFAPGAQLSVGCQSTRTGAAAVAAACATVVAALHPA